MVVAGAEYGRAVERLRAAVAEMDARVEARARELAQELVAQAARRVADADRRVAQAMAYTERAQSWARELERQRLLELDAQPRVRLTSEDLEVLTQVLLADGGPGARRVLLRLPALFEAAPEGPREQEVAL